MALESTICGIVHHARRTRAHCPTMVSSFKLSSGTVCLLGFSCRAGHIIKDKYMICGSYQVQDCTGRNGIVHHARRMTRCCNITSLGQMALESTICGIVHHARRTRAHCPTMVSSFKLSSGTVCLLGFSCRAGHNFYLIYTTRIFVCFFVLFFVFFGVLMCFFWSTTVSVFWCCCFFLI